MKESDVRSYNRVALQVNGPMYDYYAERIVRKTGIYKGKCLDAGCGGGYLGLALARITGLEFVFLDSSPGMIDCARENILTYGLAGRAYPLLGKVQSIPLPDNSLDLVVSRGSVPFWDELPSAFGEIWRLLAPGGHAYIGGGIGPFHIREALQEKLTRLCPEWQGKNKKPPKHDNDHYREALAIAGISSFTITRSDTGMWIEFRKGAN